VDVERPCPGLDDAVIHVYDEAGNVIETHEHAGDFKEPKPANPMVSAAESAVAVATGQTLALELGVE
jgi:hypothetical protein